MATTLRGFACDDGYVLDLASSERDVDDQQPRGRCYWSGEGDVSCGAPPEYVGHLDPCEPVDDEDALTMPVGAEHALALRDAGLGLIRDENLGELLFVTRGGHPRGAAYLDDLDKVWLIAPDGAVGSIDHKEPYEGVVYLTELAPVPALGLIRQEGGEGMGNHAGGEYTYWLDVLALWDGRWTKHASLEIGSRWFQRGIVEGESRTDGGFELGCPAVQGGRLVLRSDARANEYLRLRQRVGLPSAQRFCAEASGTPTRSFRPGDLGL